MDFRTGSRTKLRVTAIDGESRALRSDAVTTEEPLELRLVAANGERQALAITMRTPGNDFEMAAGFLYGEGLIESRDEIGTISYCTDPDVDPEQQYNIVNVHLRHQSLPPLKTLERHFYTTSACGVCGKANLEALQQRGQRVIESDLVVPRSVLTKLPDALRVAQSQFDATGGLHAAALFTADGHLLAAREDVGRHNAVDKLVGWALLEGRLPLADHIVLVSGRASFELCQKVSHAGAPIMCAISAPSSLAIETARTFGMTLVGFLRGKRFNIYAHAGRIS